MLVLSGSFDALTDYAIFSILIFNALVTSSIFVFRVRQPDAERPYRTWGYPATPMVFLVVVGYLLVNALITAPVQAFAGIGLILAGLPFYWYWTKYAVGRDFGMDEAHSPNYRGCFTGTARGLRRRRPTCDRALPLPAIPQWLPRAKRSSALSCRRNQSPGRGSDAPRGRPRATAPARTSL